MIYSRILGTGSYLPEQVLDNATLAQRVETNDEWIVSRTGIRERHVAALDQKTSDLALEAAKNALLHANLEASDIDLIIVATTTPDQVFPSVACLVQEKLGIHGCPAFDVQAVCAGFMYALVTADCYIRAGVAKKALVIGSEVMTRVLDWNDRKTCILFGDGAGAVVLGASEEPGLIHAKLAADGRFKDILHLSANVGDGVLNGSPYVHMDGQAVFKFAVKALSEIATQTLSEANLSKDDIDWLIPHQANLRIIESTAKHLGLSMDKVIITLPEHGNTSAASIPLALDYAVKSNKLQRGQTAMLEGIGGGFAWGAVVLKY